MPFVDWWSRLNTALTERGESKSPFGEARDWYDFRPNWRNLDPTSETRIVNIIVNARHPA